MKQIIIVACAILALGCSSRVPLTKGLIKDYGLSLGDIPKLQLYISDGILLEKRFTTIDKNIDSTSFGLKKVEDYYVKQIYVKKITPCIATSAAADKLAVAFEQPGDNLTFSAVQDGSATFFDYHPDKKFPHDSVSDRPAAAGFNRWKIIGEETYADTTYTVLIQNDLPYLLVDKTSLKNFTIDARKVKGLKQSEINGR